MVDHGRRGVAYGTGGESSRVRRTLLHSWLDQSSNAMKGKKPTRVAASLSCVVGAGRKRNVDYEDQPCLMEGAEEIREHQGS